MSRLHELPECHGKKKHKLELVEIEDDVYYRDTFTYQCKRCGIFITDKGSAGVDITKEKPNDQNT